MIESDKIFNLKTKELGNNNFLYVIEIDKIEGRLKEYIDEKLVSICYGPRNIDFETVKKKILNFLLKKKENEKELNDNTILMGAISEFMIHLFLNKMNFKQEFTFKNLEEGSIKKGFDGYYSFDNDSWILESKSGSIKTNGNSHNSKIKEAYSGLKKMLKGETANNPWENAYNHSKVVDSDDSISKKLNQLDINYTNGKFEDIKEQNIIPASTIIYDEKWSKKNDDFINEIDELIKEFDFKQIRLICLNKKSLTNFITYLES